MNKAIRRAMMIARSHYADGGETDPMLDQDVGTQDNPYKDQILSAPEPMTVGQFLAQNMRRPHEENIRSFPQDFQNLAMVQALKHLPQQTWEAIKYPAMALRGELQRGVDPITGEVTGVTESGMGPSEAGMVGAGLVSTGALPRMGAPYNPNVMSMSGAADRAVDLAKNRVLNDVGLYSHGAEVAAGLPQAKGSPDQMIAMLKKYGVKEPELEGLADKYAGQKSVTRDELAQHFQENLPQVKENVLGKGTPIDRIVLENHRRGNEYVAYDAQGQVMGAGPTESAARLSARDAEKMGENPTKFGQYTLPGGKNYREVLLKAPDKNAVSPLSARELREFEDIRALGTNQMTQDQRARYYELLGRDRDYRAGQDVNFRSPHWDDPNVLAHIRMSDRTGPAGEKLLHVEEIQSDWGQQGKKVGFTDPKATADAKEKIDQLSTQYDQLGRERRIAEKEMTDLPDYNERFYELQNRVSEIGRQRDILSDQMASLRSITKGDSVPSAPYVTSTQGWTDLALKRVLKEAAEGGYDGVVFTPSAEQAKRYDLSKQVKKISYNKNTNNLMAWGLDQSDKASPAISNFIPENEISKYVGKEAAEKLLKSEPVSGVHSLSGQDLLIGGEGMKGYYDKIVPSRLKEVIKPLDKEAKVGTIKTNRLPEMLHLPITPKMRESILAGQKAFKKGGFVQSTDVSKALNLSHQFGPAAAQDAVHIAQQLTRGRP
jgi:hypothetical protein